MARLELRAKMSLDAAQPFNILKQVEGAAGKFGSAMKSHIAQAFSVGAVVAFTKAVIDAADRWDDLADQLGTTRVNIQAVENAFIKAGLGGDAATSAALRLARAVDETLKSGEGGSVFERLGISLDELNAIGQDTGVVMRRVAEEISKMDRVTARGFARQLFGEKSGERVLAALGEISKGGVPVASEADVKKAAEDKTTFESVKTRAIAAGVTTVAEISRNSLRQNIYGIGPLGRLLVNFFRPQTRTPAAGQTPTVGQGGFIGPQQPPQMSRFNQEEFDKWQSTLKEANELALKKSTLEDRLLKAGGAGNRELNERQRVGAYVGSGGDPTDKVLKESRQMNKILKQIEENTKKSSDKFF